MARADLSSLLGKLPREEPPAATISPPTPASSATSKTPAPPTRELLGALPVSDAAAPTEPAYLGFVRKDTRLREDQLESLTREARRLNRAKRNNGLRITENTLIRLGVDLLLDRIDRASGDDEDALRESLL